MLERGAQSYQWKLNHISNINSIYFVSGFRMIGKRGKHNLNYLIVPFTLMVRRSPLILFLVTLHCAIRIHLDLCHLHCVTGPEILTGTGTGTKAGTRNMTGTGPGPGLVRDRDWDRDRERVLDQ